MRPGFEPGFRSQIDLSIFLKDYITALELLNTYQLLYPNNRLTFELQAIYHAYIEDFEKALDYFEKALLVKDERRGFKIANNNAFFYAICLQHMGRRSESSPIIANFLNENTKSGPLLTSDREVRIAAIYAFLGKKKKAYEWLRKSSWTNSALYEIRQDLWFANNKEKEFQEIVDSTSTKKNRPRRNKRLKASREWNWSKKHLN